MIINKLMIFKNAISSPSDYPVLAGPELSILKMVLGRFRAFVGAMMNLPFEVIFPVQDDGLQLKA
jgi:hypothetical protein